MGDGMLVVKFAELQNASTHIQAALNKIENDLGELERSAAPLVNSWVGEAREAYEARQNQWRDGARQLSEILRNIKVAVDDSVADYIQAEQKNAAGFRHS
jgi:6 kDa early secretory antigenic target